MKNLTAEEMLTLIEHCLDMTMNCAKCPFDEKEPGDMLDGCQDRLLQAAGRIIRELKEKEDAK